VVLADGLQQLVRRQTPCDWNAGLPKILRYNRHLVRSLRIRRTSHRLRTPLRAKRACMAGRSSLSRNYRAAASSSRLAESHQRRNSSRPYFRRWPQPERRRSMPSSTSRHKWSRPALTAASFHVWDACDDRVRDTVPTESAQWRIVQYDSCAYIEISQKCDEALIRLRRSWESRLARPA